MLRTCNESVNSCKGGIFCVFLTPYQRYLCRHCEVSHIETTIPPYMVSTKIRPRFDLVMTAWSKAGRKSILRILAALRPMDAPERRSDGFPAAARRMPRHARTGLRDLSHAVFRRVMVSLSENVREYSFFTPPNISSGRLANPTPIRVSALAPATGLEPVTVRLTVGCSAN